MAKYIVMTDGAVEFMIDITNKGAISEKMNDGFEAKLNDKGEPVVVDSESMVHSEDTAVDQLLSMINTKPGKADTKKENKNEDVDDKTTADTKVTTDVKANENDKAAVDTKAAIADNTATK